MKGAGNPHWKGGRKLDPRGYVEVLCREHPRARNGKYVYEHILVWERIHGTCLSRDFVIHHLNGVKGDNRPENLIALKVGTHHAALVTQALQLRLRELEEYVRGLERKATPTSI